MKKQLFILAILVILLPLADASQAGEPFLLKDINPAGVSNPLWLTDVDGILFFQADDGINGPELWKSDGTEESTVMVKNINPGSTGSEPAELTNINGIVFFRAVDANGSELWKSDGTPEGTVMVKDIYRGEAYPWNGSSYPMYLTNVSGTLFFTANDGTNGYELWKSDGTEEGTVMVKNINPQTSSLGNSNPSFLTNVNGTLFFTANDSMNSYELWKSDGTDAGTVMVKDIYPGFTSSSLADLTNVNGILFFSANNGINGYELWKSNGTAAGTVMVKDINPGALNSNPLEMINVNGILFFTADNGTNGDELWQSDGTEAGTIMVKDIKPGMPGSNISEMENIGSALFFAADNGTNGTELWQSGGIAAGTVMVDDIYPAAGSSWPAFLTDINGQLFLSTNDFELWIFPQKDNNDCIDAVQIFSGQTYFGSNTGASGTDLTSCAYDDTADVWFCYVPPVSGEYTITAGSLDFDTTLAVFNACGGSELACNDDYLTTDSQVSLNMIKGKRYYIRVAGFNGQTGNFQLDVLSDSCPQYIVGDLNGDCTVDIQDFALIASEWLTCNLSPPELCQ